MDKLVSIVMPSYNTGGLIALSIESVLLQSYENWELIIVDDCSTDNTDEVVKQYLDDKRIKYLKNSQNSGAAVSRNRAIREATHVDFGIYELFVDVAKELGITKMRSHQRIYVKGSDNSQKMSLLWRLEEPIKSKMLDLWQNNAHKKGISSPDGLIVCLNSSDVNKPDFLFNNIKWGNKNVGEYVIHPATGNDSPYFGKIVELRIKEYKQFTSDEQRKLFDMLDIKLVNYNGI